MLGFALSQQGCCLAWWGGEFFIHIAPSWISSALWPNGEAWSRHRTSRDERRVAPTSRTPCLIRSLARWVRDLLSQISKSIHQIANSVIWVRNSSVWISNLFKRFSDLGILVLNSLDWVKNSWWWISNSWWCIHNSDKLFTNSSAIFLILARRAVSDFNATACWTRRSFDAT